MSVVDRLRNAVPNSARHAVRRVVDPPLRPIGSIAASDATDAIALTFDDGPDPVSTPAVLDALAAHDAHATFFVLVERAEQHPDLLRRIAASGHEIGLHGLDHRRPASLARDELRTWMREGRARLARLSPRHVRWFRPPFGSQSLRSYRAARACGLDVVVWSADVEDWEAHDPGGIGRRAAARLAPGGILLMHDAFAPPAGSDDTGPEIDRGAAVTAVLKELGARGLQAVSVGQLVAEHRARRTAWFRS